MNEKTERNPNRKKPDESSALPDHSEPTYRGPPVVQRYANRLVQGYRELKNAIETERQKGSERGHMGTEKAGTG